MGGIEIAPVYTADDVKIDYARDLGSPGEYPFTRGVYETMYRGRLWTMRQFAGFGTAEETNERFRYLLEHGQTGLSTAFDMPTLMGHDSDSPRSEGEVGREGVAVDSLEDMARLFDGDPARRGLDVDDDQLARRDPARLLRLRRRAAGRPALGAARDDPDRHPQGVHRAEGVHLPARALDAARDRHGRVLRAGDAALAPDLGLRVPHPRGGLDGRPGARVHARERASPTSNGRVERGLDVDEFAPRLSFFFNAHLDFFEEIAKYRAARRIWARELRERFQAKNPRSWLMRFHTQTAGVSLTAQQPEVNIVRTAIEALAAVLGGTQSLHTNSYDEALALPTEDAARLALRTQQVIAHETNVVATSDPLGGVVLPGGAHRRARAAGLRVLRPDQRARRGGRGDQAELLPGRDRRVGFPLPARGRDRRAGHRRRQQVRCGRRGDPDPPHRPRARGATDSACP